MEKKSSFSGSLGFVLTAAGSAVGVGNIWRFPYLAAKDGGGLFLLIYLILVLTFGFTLLTTDVCIGRSLKVNALKAFDKLNHKWKFLGYLTFLVPVLIMTYYSVIGGWITKYLVAYASGHASSTANNNYFTHFITSQSPLIYVGLFFIITVIIVLMGVEKGIEKCSKIVMPGLIVLIIFIAFYSLTLNHNGRTGMQGFFIYLLPNFKGLTLSRFFEITLDAMSQLFFSLSVSMGIMITYGSYVNKEVNLNKTLSQIELFDTGVAFLAGMMIIPAVYVFSGPEGMKAGANLMFVSLPQIFNQMGSFGPIIGTLFFLMVFFAALTSCVSVLETIVANCIEIFNQSRKFITGICFIIFGAASIIISLGYNKLFLNVLLPNGSYGQLLDVVDYISNSVLMPFISFCTCVLIGYIVKPDFIIHEMEYPHFKFKRKHLYSFMIKYVSPVIMFILFLQSTGILTKVFH